MSASVAELSDLHRLVAQVFKQELEISMNEGIPIAASTLAVMVKFLKDNNITAEASAEDMQALKSLFEEEFKEKRNRAQTIVATNAQDDVISQLIN